MDFDASFLNTSFVNDPDKENTNIYQKLLKDIKRDKDDKKQWYICEICNPDEKRFVGKRNMKEHIDNHIYSANHLLAKYAKMKVLKTLSLDLDMFHHDLAMILAYFDLPFSLVEKPEFKILFWKYFGVKIKSRLFL